MKLIGLSGTNGSGKDTVAALLAEGYSFLNASATNMLLVGLQERGWAIDRTNKSKLSAEWRRERGMAVIVDMAVEMLNENPDRYKGVVIGSLRHPGEADRVHELGGILIWTDADPRVRYDRIQTNLHERVGTHAEHGTTFEEFLADEEREMHPEGDEATLNMAGVKAKSDIFLNNDGDNIEAFKNEAKETLADYLSN